MEQVETWPRCPEADAFFRRTLNSFATENPRIEEMGRLFQSEAGVDLGALVDHWILPDTAALRSRLAELGLVETRAGETAVWEHPRARLPRVRLAEVHAPRLALAVEDVERFLNANGLTPIRRVGGDLMGYEEAACALQHGELAVVLRMGTRGFEPLAEIEPDQLDAVRKALRDRDRTGDWSLVIERGRDLYMQAAALLGGSRATDEFFAAERDYYMTRNGAAQWQYAQQQMLGFGWANHDHHTYRCSRDCFRAMMGLWRTMGFEFRERFYAGAEAGWGAQVLEHPVSRVVLFTDVDIAPEELEIDFAAEDLAPRTELGTIGLWCALHGDSIGHAGMHHLEAEFDFTRVAANLEAAGYGVMAPFTDLPMLKQAFTLPELWPVPQARTRALMAQGALTSEQAERFVTLGAAGSHLEILQRREGFKGFNKTGVSAIIRQTDARLAARSEAAM